MVTLERYNDRDTNLHAHFSWGSRDCDGTYSGGYDKHIKDTPETVQSDVDFFGWVIDSMHYFYSFEYEAEMKFYRDDRGRRCAHYHEVTDEGYRGVSVIMCEEECELEGPEFRDHRAEEMGY